MEFPKFQTGIFVEWKAPLVSGPEETGPVRLDSCDLEVSNESMCHWQKISGCNLTCAIPHYRKLTMHLIY